MSEGSSVVVEQIQADGIWNGRGVIDAPLLTVLTASPFLLSCNPTFSSSSSSSFFGGCSVLLLYHSRNCLQITDPTQRRFAADVVVVATKATAIAAIAAATLLLIKQELIMFRLTSEIKRGEERDEGSIWRKYSWRHPLSLSLLSLRLFL